MSHGLNARQLKLIACVSMLFSHIGFIFWPHQLWWQIPGRLAMPIFAYMIANGARHSHNQQAYLLRLFLFALLVQYPYQLFLGLGYLNICFTLSGGLAAILLWQSPLPLLARLPGVLGLGLLAEVCGSEYGLYGIMMIFSAQLFFDNRRGLALCWFIINLPYLAEAALALMRGDSYLPVQGFCLLALPFLLLYNGRRGAGSRWEFYLFYIGHLAALYYLRLFLWGY